MKKRPIKAVDLVRRIRDRHHEQLKGKSLEERIEFYRKKARSTNERFLEVQKRRKMKGG